MNEEGRPLHSHSWSSLYTGEAGSCQSPGGKVQEESAGTRKCLEGLGEIPTHDLKTPIPGSRVPPL